MRVDSWWCQSRRLSATFACCRASFDLAFRRFADPFCLRDNSCCSRLSLRSARRRNLGAASLSPSDVTTKWVRPRSMPHSASACGSAAGSTSTTKDAQYRSAPSRTTVTEDGAAGSGQRPRPYGRDVADLRDIELAVVSDHEGVGRQPNRLPCVAFRLEARKADLRPASRTSPGCEKRSIGAVQVPERLDENHRRHLGQPDALRRRLGPRDHALLELTVIDEPLPCGERLLPESQPVVVHHPGAPECSGERIALRGVRIQAVPVAQQHASDAMAVQRAGGEHSRDGYPNE